MDSPTVQEGAKQGAGMLGDFFGNIFKPGGGIGGGVDYGRGISGPGVFNR